MAASLNTGYFLILFIPTVLLISFMPYLTRKTELFGITIPVDRSLSMDLNKLKKLYFILSFVWGGILFLIYFFINHGHYAWLSPVLLLVFMAGAFVLYTYFHFKVKTLKNYEGWTSQHPQEIVVDTAFRQHGPVHSLWWFTVPFLLAVITLGLTIHFYDIIPNRLPLHFDASGHVTTTIPKASRFLYFNIALQVYMTLLFALIHASIGWAKLQIDPSDPKRSVKQNLIFRRRWSLYMILSSIVLVLLFGCMQMGLIWSWQGLSLLIISLIAIALLLIGAFFLSFSTGQGGSRIKMAGAEEQVGSPRDEDQYWKLGLFYVNKNDPSLFVEKRFGIGWTVNFAHPGGYITLLLIIVVIFIIQRIFT